MSQTQTTDRQMPSRLGKLILVDSAPPLDQQELAELSHPKLANWEIVKHTASRTVYHGLLGGQEVYVKHFHSRSWLHRLARRLSGGEARHEMNSLLYLSSQGIATAAPLAAMGGDGTEWLATRAVAPAQRADIWHERQLTSGPGGLRRIRQATVAMGRLVGRMHTAGVFHRDLHCGNILVRTDSTGPQLVLMDLHRVSRRRWLSRRARAANIAQLFHDRRDFTSRTDRLRFLKSYLAESRAGGSLRSWQEVIESFARRHTRRQNAQRDRRTLGAGRYFSPIRLGGGWRGHVVLTSKRRMGGSRAAEMEFNLDDWRLALRDPGALFSATGAEVIKDSPSSLIVRRTLSVGPHRVEVFVKRARRKKPWKALADCFRPSRPIRAFELGHAMLTRRIATALPLAALERRRGPFLQDSILITEAVNAPRLNRFMEAHLTVPLKGPAPMTASQQRRLGQEVLWQLGRLLQRLHDYSFAHRDLKATNILVRWQPGLAPEVVLVDLDGLHRKRSLTARRRFQGLMRLNVSLLDCPVVNRAGRLRMLLGYLRRPGGGRINFKPYWHMLEDWSERTRRRQIRSRRKRQRAARRPGP
jgi:tRNA A-37 threonylcarbamoyl transferase component Bud32